MKTNSGEPQDLDQATIRLLAEFPLAVACGGLELQCLKTFSAFRELGLNVRLLDYHNKDDTHDILHLFGNPPSLFEVIFHACKTKKVVISAVCGAQEFSPVKAVARQAFSRLGSMIGERTDYARLRFMFQAAEQVICLNELEKEFICRTYNVSQEKLTVIPNGVEENFLSGTKELFVEKYGMTDFVLYTGNIVRRKNPLRLAQVLEKLGRKGVFIGNPLSAESEYAARFEAVISRSPNLFWVKGLSYDDPLLPSAYAAAAVFCLPSTGETQSLSALEAMATATPVILGDFPYAYQDPFKKSLKCNPADEASIERCLVEVQNNPTPYIVQLPDEFQWRSVARQIAEVYERLLICAQE